MQTRCRNRGRHSRKHGKTGRRTHHRRQNRPHLRQDCHLRNRRHPRGARKRCHNPHSPDNRGRRTQHGKGDKVLQAHRRIQGRKTQRRRDSRQVHLKRLPRLRRERGSHRIRHQPAQTLREGRRCRRYRVHLQRRKQTRRRGTPPRRHKHFRPEVNRHHRRFRDPRQDGICRYAQNNDIPRK